MLRSGTSLFSATYVPRSYLRTSDMFLHETCFGLIRQRMLESIVVYMQLCFLFSRRSTRSFRLLNEYLS